MAIDGVQSMEVAAPELFSGAYGLLRAAVVDALVCGVTAQVPQRMVSDLERWAVETCSGPARGVAIDTLPPHWADTLSWAGVPLARAGKLRWGMDLIQEAALDRPLIEGERLLLPPTAMLADLTGLGIKPVRQWVAARLGLRLQAAPGLRMWLFAQQAVLVSTLDLPVGGFLYGPAAGSRTNLSLQPGGYQVVSW